jgi:dCMP deaminase
MTWDEYFISMCYLVAMKSKDPSTKVGAVIVDAGNEVVSTGFNSLPRGANDNVPERFCRPLKQSFMSHAEANAIALAARKGHPTKDCSIYVTWFPCIECSRLIIQSGIKEVIIHADFPGIKENEGSWAEGMVIGQELMQECGVNVRFWSGNIQTPVAVFQGKEYKLDNLKT